MNKQYKQFNFFGSVVVIAESQKAAERQLLKVMTKNAIGCSFSLSPPQAPVSGFDAVGALESAISMLKLKPEDCLGCVQESCTEGWWIRDELIDNLCKVRNALASTQPPTAELLALPDKWREDERQHMQEAGTADTNYRLPNDCADELESILSRMQESNDDNV